MDFFVIVFTTTVTVLAAGSLLERVWVFISRVPQSGHLSAAGALGLLVGLLLACSARCGSAPRARRAFLLRPAAALLAFAVAVAAISGAAGSLLFSHAEPETWQPLSGDPAFVRYPGTTGLLCSELGGAATILIGGTALALFTLKTRRRAHGNETRG